MKYVHIKEGNINYFDTIIIIDFQREVNEEEKYYLFLNSIFDRGIFCPLV